LKVVAEREEASVLVGLGKAMDTAKGVGHEAGVRWAMLPTIVSTDTPTSALSVIYTDDGVFEEYMLLPRNPDLILVDTQVAANAPVRFLVAGMGNALATWAEAPRGGRGAKHRVGGHASPGVAARTQLRL
jgi:glycerol dehydrogenase